MTKVWRLAAAGDFEADDLSGEGAQAIGGRWNSRGRPMVYTSSSVALCVLETIVHFDLTSYPIERFLIEVDIPDEVYSRRRVSRNLPATWAAVPYGRESQAYGDRWLKSGRELLLDVPSAVVPQERNILINPLHPDFAAIRKRNRGRFVYDARLLQPLSSSNTK